MDQDMIKILKEFSLEEFEEIFKRENITPDIASQLSLYDFEKLGITDKDIITRLRKECCVVGAQPSKKIQENTAGAPKFLLHKDILQNLLENGFLISEIAERLSISERTLYRRMKEFQLIKPNFTEISDTQLDVELSKAIIQFPFSDEDMLNRVLKRKGIVIERMKLRDSLYRVDQTKISKPLPRKRIYNVLGPNHLWHIDTNHQLFRWYFATVAIMDGFSRLPVALECTPDNKPETIFICFKKAVDLYGLPSRVRSDKGKENVKVAQFMIENRGLNRQSMITGKRAFNKRIEILWTDVYNGVLSLYSQLFYFMEEEGILDPLNPNHLIALHLTFLKNINRHLEIWSSTWSPGTTTTSVKNTPLKLWLSGQLHNVTGTSPSEVNQFYGVEGTIESDDGKRDLERPMFESPTVNLREECRIRLQSLPLFTVENDYGIKRYLNTLEIISLYNS